MADSDLNDTPILEAQNLRIGYGQSGECPVLDGIDLKLGRGEFVGLFGANGSGKSTLLRTLAGLQPALSGEIQLNGLPADTFSPRRRAHWVSVVLTGQNVIPRTKVEQLVALGRQPYTNWAGMLTPSDRKAVDEALSSTHMESFRDRSLDQMSDGERQRAMIARAVAQATPLMLLDEPTAFLDLPGKAEILGLLRDISHRRNLAILLSSHDLSLLLRVADRCLLIDRKGRIHNGAPEDLVLNGTIAEVFDRRGIRFNEESGHMEVERQNKGNIVLIGEGLASQWTARALQRSGFAVNEPNQPYFARVEVSGAVGEFSWRFEKGDASPVVFKSIHSLLTHTQSR